MIWLLLAAALAQDGETDDKTQVKVNFTEDFEIRYWVIDERLPDPDDVPVLNYIEQVNRFNAVASAGKWSFGVQVDEVMLFANRYYLDDQLQVERQLTQQGTMYNVLDPLWDQGADGYTNIEKVSARYSGKGVTVSLGDYYASFGRGIALNVNRNVDIDIDTSIQGVKVAARPGAWDVVVVAGQLNRQQVFQDNPNLNLYGDRRHFVGGVRVDRYGIGPASIGAHTVAYNFVDDEGPIEGFEEMATAPDAVIGGASVDLPGVAGIDWFLEGDVIGYPTTRLALEGVPRTGYGVYGSAAIYGEKAIWLVEVKRYKEMEHLNRALADELYEVAIGPTLEYERQITEDSSATVNSNDIWGARVRVDAVTRYGQPKPYASFALYRDDELGPLHFNASPETIIHPVGGLEWVTDNSAMFWNVGYRRDRRDDLLASGADQQSHTDFQWTTPLTAGLYMNLAVAAEYYQWGNNPFQQTDYIESESSIGISKGSLFSITYFSDFTTNPIIDSTGNLTDALYGAVEVQVKPNPSTTIKAFYGAYKAGIRCSGGQCRVLPGFEGARASFQASF